jgi:hypothetical protein
MLQDSGRQKDTSMIQRELDELIQQGMPCRKCRLPATHHDSTQVPWCNNCDPAFENAKVITQSEVNRLVQQLVDLRAALEPFAAFAACLPAVMEGQSRITDTEGTALNCYYLGENYSITFGHLRAAKALLEGLKKEDFERWVTFAEEKMATVSTQRERLAQLGASTETLDKMERNEAERESLLNYLLQTLTKPSTKPK